jgi:hypothetical protein
LRQPCAPCGVRSGCRNSPAVQTVMNYPSSLTSTRQRAETSKEAGDNSMIATPPCGEPDIPKSRRQGEEHRAKAILPEPQIDTGGSHSPLIPDKGRLPDAVRSVRLCELKQSRDGAGNKPDNDRTGRLRAHGHHFLCTTGSPNQDSAPARRRSPHTTRRVGITPGAAGLKAGRKRGITGEQSLGKSSACGGRRTVRSSKKNA